MQRDLTLDLTPIFDWCPEVDVLCNTAGVLDDYKPLLEQSAQEIQEIFEINYVTPGGADAALSDSNVGEEARDHHQYVLHCF